MNEEWRERVRMWSQRVEIHPSADDGTLAIECAWSYDPSVDEDIREESWVLAKIEGHDIVLYQVNPDADEAPEWLKELISRIRASGPYL